MTQEVAIPSEDRNGVLWRDYVRKVEFIDRAIADEDDPPVHVSQSILFDGSPLCRVRRSDAATVDLSATDGTVLTLHVHRDDVQIGYMEGDAYIPHLLGDRRVVTPTEKGWEWGLLDPEDPDNPWMVVSIYVSEIHVRQS